MDVKKLVPKQDTMAKVKNKVFNKHTAKDTDEIYKNIISK